jgi:hypothetical protein
MNKTIFYIGAIIGIMLFAYLYNKFFKKKERIK